MHRQCCGAHGVRINTHDAWGLGRSPSAKSAMLQFLSLPCYLPPLRTVYSCTPCISEFAQTCHTSGWRTSLPWRHGWLLTFDWAIFAASTAGRRSPAGGSMRVALHDVLRHSLIAMPAAPARHCTRHLKVKKGPVAAKTT